MKARFSIFLLSTLVMVKSYGQGSVSISKLKLLIDNSFYLGRQGSPDLTLQVNVLLVNNSNDTLKVVGTDCQYSTLYKCDNKNMILIDEKCEKKAFDRIVIPPYKNSWTQLSFKFNKLPDTTFKFKVGMKLLNCSANFSKHSLDEAALTKSDIIWSEEEVFRTNKKHQMYGNTEEDQKKLILQKPLPIYYPLTQQDKNNYILSIDQRKVEKWRDTFIYRQDYMFTEFPLVLSNRSNDTLKYINMSCSWQEIYTTNIQAVQLLSNGCDKNVPVVLAVAPGKSFVINVPVMYRKGSLGNNTMLKIGMSLQKYIDWSQLFDFDAYVYALRPETSNLIWSNKIKVR